MKMNRRFMYLLLEAPLSKYGTYTLRRINPSRLFYRKDSPERAAAAAATAAPGAGRATTSKAAPARVVEDARLPPPTTTIRSNSCAPPWFTLLGRDKDKILVEGVDEYNVIRAVLYDDRSRSFHALPSLSRHMIRPFSVAVGDSLYFLDGRNYDGSGEDGHDDDSNHEDGDDDDSSDEDGDDDDDSSDEDDEEDHEVLVLDCDGQYCWRGRAVPPPLQERMGMDRNDKRRAYAVVGESTIWVSAGSHGTLSLDTASGTWSKVGDWPLPFVGQAVHAPDPEHGDLWFDFSAETHLEAWDLRADGWPASRLRWVDIPGIDDERVVQSEVAVLGDGRLCVARLFEVSKPPPSRGHCSCCYYRTEHQRKRLFAMLTGLEVVDEGYGGGLRLIEHKSCRYNLGVGARHFPDQGSFAKFLF